MSAYIAKRLLAAIPVLFGLTIIVFLIMAMIPGDPATAILGSYATPENVAKLNRDLGLDAPLWQRYFIWLGNMLTGDFGQGIGVGRIKQLVLATAPERDVVMATARRNAHEGLRHETRDQIVLARDLGTDLAVGR